MEENRLSFLGAASLFFSAPFLAISGEDRHSDSCQPVVTGNGRLLYQAVPCNLQNLPGPPPFAAALQALRVRKKLAQSDHKNKRLAIIEREVALCSLLPPSPPLQPSLLKAMDGIRGESGSDTQRDLHGVRRRESCTQVLTCCVTT